MASGSAADTTIKIWNINTGITIKTLYGHTHSVESLVVLPDGLLASCNSDKTIRIWNVTSGININTLTRNNQFLITGFSMISC